jgi:hypothetical protein
MQQTHTATVDARQRRPAVMVAEMEQPSGWGTCATCRTPAVNVASALDGAGHPPRRITFAQPMGRGVVLPTTLN